MCSPSIIKNMQPLSIRRMWLVCKRGWNMPNLVVCFGNQLLHYIIKYLYMSIFICLGRLRSSFLGYENVFTKNNRINGIQADSQCGTNLLILMIKGSLIFFL